MRTVLVEDESWELAITESERGRENWREDVLVVL